MARAAGRRQEGLASQALRSLRPTALGIGLFSAGINLLMLTGSLYMLQVYDRVLSSRSVPTLVGITLIALVAYVAQGLLEHIRGRMLARMGARFDEAISERAFLTVQNLSLAGLRPDQALQPVRDLDQVRTFLSGQGPTALFDMPWMPIFFAMCFLLHPWLGLLAVVGGVVIVLLTLLTEVMSRKPTAASIQSGGERQALAESARRQAEVLRAMGMARSFSGRWRRINDRHIGDGLQVSDAAGGIGAAARVFRFAFQSGMLGLGAYLVLRGEATPGAMIAASILSARALAPIEVAVANWRGFVAARQGFARLDELIKPLPEGERTALPAPRRDLTVEDGAVGVPGRPVPLLAGVQIHLRPGQALLLAGPSGAGKSTLLRAMAGIVPLARGQVRIDGATLDQWGPEALGRHLGYLPQTVDLFEGTVAENIARFDPEARSEAVIAAAEAAGAHHMILALPEGYETRLGDGGSGLSGGQRQRIGLARALFGDPFLVLLDEPNANLDQEGERALALALRAVRDRGGIAVIVSHQIALLDVCSHIGRVAGGRVEVLSVEQYRAEAAARRQQPGATDVRPAAGRSPGAPAAAPVRPLPTGPRATTPDDAPVPAATGAALAPLSMGTALTVRPRPARAPAPGGAAAPASATTRAEAHRSPTGAATEEPRVEKVP